MNRHLNTRNTRLSIPSATLRASLALLLGLFITASALLMPAAELLTNLYSADAPNATPELLAGPERDTDHG